MGKWTRRAFIGTGALVGGGFVLGVTGAVFAPSRHSVRPDDAETSGQLNTRILVTPDNIVTVLVPHCEMGQGAQTALAMMAAEEMDADWNLVRFKEAPALDAYANADMNVLKAAESLGVHSNTVYGRLQKIADLTGHDARSFNSLSELLLATACRL